MWFDEYDNIPVRVDVNKYDDFDEQSDQEEYTYDDLISLVKSVNNGSSNDLTSLQEIVIDIMTDYELEKEKLDNIIEDLWETEMEQYINFDCYEVFTDDLQRIKQGFITWIYQNNDTIHKLNYLTELNNAIFSYLNN